MRTVLFLLLVTSLAVFVGCNVTNPPEVADTQPNLELTVRPDDDNRLIDLAERAIRRRALRERGELRALQQARAGGPSRVPTAPTNHIVVPDDYATIQDAVDNAAPGTKIEVKDKGSNYFELVYIDTDGLKIIGVGGPTVEGGFEIEDAYGVKIENFNIVDDGEIGIYVCDSRDIHITGNTIDLEEHAVALDYSDDCKIRDNHLESEFDEPIEGYECDNLHIVRNTIVSPDDDGIILDDCNNSKIFRNVINDVDNDGIDLNGGRNHNVQKNETNRCGDNGIELDDVTDSKIGPHNTSNDNDGYGVTLWDSDRNLVLKNELCGNASGAVDLDGDDNKIKNNVTDCP